MSTEVQQADPPESPLGNQFLNQNAAIKYLECCRTKFYKLRKRHQIPHYRGRSVFSKRRSRRLLSKS